MKPEALAARIENLLGSSPSSSADNIPSRPPPPIPDHEILTRIGGGSYGEVWLARSVTGALRAVKVVWRSHFSSARPYEREFHGIVRFEPISRSHPGVVNVLHVGRDDTAECFFYLMELADSVSGPPCSVSSQSPHNSTVAAPSHPGSPSPLTTSYKPRTLASDLKTQMRLPVADVVSLGVQLAGALGHLHRHWLVHRDVKPSNIIFVHGQPKLADIGLVTGVHEERSFVGTEGFIPPEGPGSERADLFSLGRLLYEAATGKNRSDFPGLPDDLDRWPSKEREALIELNEVLARACAPEARKRHSNAAELAGDLNLILAGRSVRRAYGIERQLRRATLVSVVALILVFGTILSNWLQRRQREVSDARAKREAVLREQTQKSLARAEAAERESRQQLYTALFEQARATVLSREVGQRVRALEALGRAAAISNTAELRREAFAALALPDLRVERELSFAADSTECPLDPSFARIAVARGRGPVEIWSVAEQCLLTTLPASTNLPVYVMEWSDDGRFLAVKRDYTGGARADWEVWEMEQRQRVLLLRNVPHEAVCFHPRLPWILAGDRQAAAIWDLQNGNEVRRFSLPRTPDYLRFAPDGERFAALHPREPRGGGASITLHEVKNASAPPLVTKVFPASLTRCSWHPDGSWLGVTDDSGNIHRLDADSGETRQIGRHKAEAVRVMFSPDGAYLMTSGWEREMICWDTRTLQRAFTIRLGAYLFQFRQDGGALAIQSRSGLQLHTFERPSSKRGFAEDLGMRVQQAAFSADGRWFAASGNKRLGVWDLTVSGPGALEEKGHSTHCYFTPDGQQLFSSRRIDVVSGCFRWRITSATELDGPPRLEPLPLPTPPGFAFVSLNSDSILMTSTNGTQVLALDELEAGKEDWTRTPFGLNRASPDGRWMGISRLRSSSLYVHRLPGFEPVTKLTHLTNVHHFEFSPRGDEVALCSSLGVELYSTDTWKRTRLLTNFDRSACLYTPDGRGLWLTKGLSAAGLYDARTLEPLLLLPRGMLPLAVSPDGRRLAVSVEMLGLEVWDLVALREQLHSLGLDWERR